MWNQFIRIGRSVGALLLWVLLFACTNPSRADVNLVISEVMAANRRTLADQDGEFSDWIEIYNPSSDPVSLDGWYLTDNPKALTKWRFPAAKIKGNGYLVVFASQKSNRARSDQLHANFKLDGSGEYLALVKPDGSTISFQFEPTLPVLVSDVSFGIDPKTLKEAAENATHNFSTNNFGYFAAPTPGAPNREVLSRIAPAPQCSRPGGVFWNNCTVELKANAPEATIRYTIDGTEPHGGSPVYSNPINVTVTTIIKARTFATGQAPSATVAQSYTIADESLSGFSSNIPLVVLEIEGRGRISSDSPAPATLRIIDTPGGKRASIAGAANYDGEARIRYRGYTSLRYAKKSFALKLTDPSGESLKAPLLDMPKDNDWILYAPYPDKALIRDVLAYELSNKMGWWAPRTKFVELYVSRTGSRLTRSDYQGVYVLEEKIKRAKERVNIQELGPGDNAESNISGGYILKKDHDDKPDPRFHSSRGVEFFYVEPEFQDMTAAQQKWIRNYIDRVDRAVYGAQFRDPQRGYRALIDMDSFIDYFWIVEMSKNIDGFRFSTFFTLDRGGKLKIHPIWDWNLSFGNAMGRGGYSPQGWYYETLREGDQQFTWYPRLFEDRDFEQRKIDRWAELRRDIFSPQKVLQRVDEMAAQLEEAQERNFQKWPILGQRIMPNYYVFGTYAEEINHVKTWTRNRIAWIDRQIPAPPAANRNGDTVTLRASQGTLYYTLDGSDPRSSGGAVSPNAQTYSSPVKVANGKKLTARAQLDGMWTPPSVVTGPSDSN